MKLFFSTILISILFSVFVNAQQIEKGITTFGSSAVSETVSDIMARQILGAKNPRSVEAEKEKEYPDRHNLPQNLNSPGVSSYSSKLKISNSPNQVNSSATISKGLSFTGGTLTGGGAYPPDNMGSVGPTQYIVCINSIVTSFNKTTGLADGVLNITTDNFFASVMSTASGTFTSDPHIRYDRLTKRWIFIIIDVPSGTGSVANRVLVGVSADSTITPSTVIKFFYYQNSGNFIDYPTLGIDKNAIYIGGNLFNLAGTAFLGTIGLVVQKTSIMGSGPMVSTKFTLGGASSGIYTPQGVDNLYDLTATEGYFIGVDAGTYGILDLVRVLNPGSGSPSVSAAVTITVPTTYAPGTFFAKPGSSSYNLDPDDERLFAAMIRNGHIWTAHHIETTNTGVGSSSGTRISARWYDLINYKTGFTPALNQSGTVFSNALTTTRDRNFGYPTISANGQGHALMGFTIAGYYSYANAGYTYRLANDPAGTMTAPDSNTASSTSYNPGDGSPHRWGDYSMTEVDPTDDMTFWTIQQYCNGTNNYGCRVSSFKAPAPAPLISATPNVLGAGSNLTLLLKGDTTTTTGLGFYEPGSGFSKHLSVSIDGNITVNSISYVSPGTILITVNTTGATDGARIVTVTNPDGQVVSSGSILTYHIASSPVLAVTPTSLTGFNYSFGYGPSLSQSYNLSGTNLTGFPGSITVSAPTNFEVSLDDVNFAASKLVPFTSATLGSTAIHVRLKSGLSIAPYSGYVTNAGGGAVTLNDTCSGVVNPVPSPTISVSPGTLSGFICTVGAGPSVSQSYTLSGTYLIPSSGNITVQCLTNYEVSTDNSTFSASVSPAYTGGMLSATTIYVRLKAGLIAGNYNSEPVSNAGGGASTQYVSCSGVVYDIGTLFVDDFSYTLGTLLTANGWVAHSGAGTNPPQITSPGLTYGNYFGSGVGNAVTLSGDGEDDNHPFTTTSSGSVYASAMIKVTSANSTGDYFFHFGVTGSTAYNARVFVKSATGGFVFGVCKSGTTGNIQWSPTVLAIGSTNFIVLKYTFVLGAANDNAELFINPAVGGSEPASDLSSLTTDADFTAIDKICLRQSSTTPVVIIDGIRVGQTWASVTPAAIKTLALTALVEAMYVKGGSAMPMTPSVTVELHDGSTLALVDSNTSTLSTLGVGSFSFINALNGTPYYIVVKYANTVEIWSATPQSFTAGTLSYDFTTGTAKAYTDGSNLPLALHGSKYCIYSGDVNQNGFITSADFTGIDNDASAGDYHLVNDLNGDLFVTSNDFTFIDNNASAGIQRQVPPGAPAISISDSHKNIKVKSQK